jgi:predicted nuclease of predicted toxin-antitoxin system
VKVLLDSCISRFAKAELLAAGHDVIWTGDLSDDPGDRAILEWANRESRVVITLDKDFGELAIVHRLPHHGILRLVNASSRLQGQIAITVIARHGAELLGGAIITAELGRIRIRPPEATET